MVAVFNWVDWNLGHDRCLTLARDDKIEIFCKMALSNDDSFGWYTAIETMHADKCKIVLFLFFFFFTVNDLHGGSFGEFGYFYISIRKMLNLTSFHKYVCARNVHINQCRCSCYCTCCNHFVKAMMSYL